ncbi:MAG: PocR ligand-binding domain-containing protein [Oscillospiraceae bacterium]|nr:PocR ligand-binding domain-containing protein [Oscillospiraceae bacterium]
MRWKDLPQSEFDLRLAGECIESFSGATGLGCTISDIHGNVLGEAGCGYPSCRLCSISHKEISCSEVHIYGMDEAERFGGRYIYFCPAGLTFFVSPILDQLGSVGKITVGPFLMVEREDYDFLDLQQHLGLKGSTLKEARKLLQDIPYIDPDKVTALSNMLYFSVSFISNVWSSAQMLETQHSDAIQASIGEYIYEMKTADHTLQYHYATEKLLLNSIINYDRDQAGEALNDLLGYIFFSSGGEIEQIKHSVYELLVLMSRAAVEGGAQPEATLQQNFNYHRRLQSFQDMDDLCLWITKTMNRFMNSTFDLRDIKHLDVIHKTTQFVRDHYNEKITVEQAASNVYLSASYFSKVFKEDMGISFSTYLNQVRIEKSKELLKNKQHKIIDVAIMVGFEDQSYFTKVFKRVAGVSPNHYRESLGRA